MPDINLILIQCKIFELSEFDINNSNSFQMPRSIYSASGNDWHNSDKHHISL